MQVGITRVQRIIYTPDWKDGRSKTEPKFDDLGGTPPWVGRSPRLIKVIQLESYEDALQNFVATAEKGKDEKVTKAHKKEVGDKAYRLKYMLKLRMEASDTLLNIEKLEHPFNYTLEILTEDGPKEKPVDLIETTNMLLGISVDKMETWEGKDKRHYVVIKGSIKGESSIVVWRDTKSLDPKKERAFLEPKLKGFTRKLINADCAVPGAESIDLLLHAAMRG